MQRKIRVIRRLPVVGRKVTQQLFRLLETLLFALGHQMRDTTLLAVDLGAPELLRGHLFPGHRLDDVRSRDMHLADPIHHEHKIR